jgi:hypothetical protein
MSRKPPCPVTCHGGAIRRPTFLPGIWDCYDRSWRSTSAIRRASCSPPTRVRASYPVRHQSAGWGPLQAYRAIVDLAQIAAISFFQSTDRLAVHGRCMSVPPWLISLGGDNWTMAGRRLSPYRARVSPRRKLPALRNFARPSLSRASAKRIAIPTMRL